MGETGRRLNELIESLERCGLIERRVVLGGGEWYPILTDLKRIEDEHTALIEYLGLEVKEVTRHLKIVKKKEVGSETNQKEKE